MTVRFRPLSITILFGLVALVGVVLLGACRPAAPRPPATSVLPAGATASTSGDTGRPSAVSTSPAPPAPSPTPFYVSRVTAPPGVLVYPLDAAPTGVDPQEDDDDASALVEAQLYEGLFDLRGDGQLAPAAATGYRVSADGKTYTVTLRSGVVWSDSRPVTAQDYVAGVCRALSPAIGSRFAYLLRDVAVIHGAESYAAGVSPDCSQVGVKAVDPQTLQIALDRPQPYFPQLLASRAFWPALPGNTGTSGAGGPAVGARVTEAAAGPTVPVVPVGSGGAAAPLMPVNGPYQVAEWQPGDHVTLVKNPRFWAADQVAIATINLPVMTGAGAQWAAYQEGIVHISAVPADVAGAAWHDAVLHRELAILPQPGTSYLGLNTAITPTTDLNVRRAIAAAIDRRIIISDVLAAPWHNPAVGLLPAGLAANVSTLPATAQSANLEAARQFLAQAGFSASNPPPPINIWANREGQNAAVANAIAAMLERAGLPTRLVLSSWDVFHQSLEGCRLAPGACDYHIFLAGWLMDAGDPARFLGTALGAQPATGYTGWQSADYQAVLTQAAAAADPQNRSELYRKAEGLLLDQVVVVPLIYYDRLVFLKPGLQTEYPLFGPVHLRYWRFTSAP